jgi:chitinase
MEERRLMATSIAPGIAIESPNTQGAALLSSGTGGHAGATVQGQNTGNAVISLAGSTLGQTSNSQSAETAGPKLPRLLFAPYLDETAHVAADLHVDTLASSIKTKYLSLGFITSDSKGNPVFGSSSNSPFAIGSQAANPDYSVTLKDSIASLQKEGGDVILSFGGARGSELAQTIMNLSRLEAAYQKVIRFYNIHHIDFDIETSSELSNTASINERSQAMQWLQQEDPGLTISLTLPVDPSGLPKAELNVLTSALDAGVKLSEVNVMTMHFGSGRETAANAESAATETEAQLAKIDPRNSSAQTWAMIGMTTRPDPSDVIGFDLGITAKVAAWAKSKGVGLFSFWGGEISTSELDSFAKDVENNY